MHSNFNKLYQFRNVYLSLIGLIILSFSCTKNASLDIQPESIRQSEPVIALLKAIKENNVALLQSAYSDRMKARFMKENRFRGDWHNVLEYLAGVVRHGIFGKGGFGDYNLKDFRFIYSGSESAGEVTLIFKGREDGALDVIKENGNWKIDET